MRDSELAACIVDGDAEALAEAYDKYADLLWSYSRSLLNDADGAAEVVADTFVIAASRLDVLSVPGRLRAWLYAVTRSECQRRLRAAKDGQSVYGAERLRHAAEVLSTGEQRYLRALLAEAFGGLDDAECDAMQMVWHGLDLAEVAAVLGITRSDAYALFTRARDQLETSVGVLLMGWAGSGGCSAFEDMLYGKDASLTPDLRTRLSRHIAKCGTCAAQHRRQLRPSLTLCLSVGALLSEASDARVAASPAPSGLWERVYQMTASHSPEARWHKIIGGRRLSFGPDGFPKQAAALREGLARTPFKVAAVGAVALAATATGWAAHGHHTARTGASPTVTAVMPDASTATAPGAHSGPPSPKASSTHKARHARLATPAVTPLSAGSPVGVSQGAVAVPAGSSAVSPGSGTASSGSGARTSGGSTSGSTSASGGVSSSGSGASSSAPKTSTSTSTSTKSGPVSGLLSPVVSVSKGLTSTLGLP